ncbi:MAG: hypothetical protein P4L67_05235 [Candidatus Pacebacteria bacterium]|nr:hypothetical protein [Candidatus Paceibacterota bacterium]
MNIQDCSFPVNGDRFTFALVSKDAHDTTVAIKDARIKELEASLYEAQFDLKYAKWSTDNAYAVVDKLGIRIGKLRVHLAARDAEIAELKLRITSGDAE